MQYVNIDFENEPFGVGKEGKHIFLGDVWPSSEETTNVSFQTNYNAEECLNVIEFTWKLELFITRVCIVAQTFPFYLLS